MTGQCLFAGFWTAASFLSCGTGLWPVLWGDPRSAADALVGLRRKAGQGTGREPGGPPHKATLCTRRPIHE